MSLVFMNAIINIHMFLLGENPNIDTKVNDLVSWYLLFVYVKVKYIYFGVIHLSSERVLEKLKCSNSNNRETKSEKRKKSFFETP